MNAAVTEWWPVVVVLLLHQLPVGMTGVVTGPTLLTVAFALGVSVPLRWRRTHPLWVCACLAVVLVAQVVVLGPSLRFGSFVALMIASFAASANQPLGRAVIGLAVTLGTVVVLAPFDQPLNPVDFVFPLVYLGGAWAVGVAVRRHRLTAERLAELTQSLRDEQEHSARLAAAAERAHIAREVHDIVAHSLGVIVVQAEAAAGVLDGESPAQRPLAIIQGAGRSALAELRGVLAGLRNAEDGLDPQPRISELPRLVEGVRASGLDVSLSIAGAVDALPEGLQLSVFRIVQEALTNALKHGERDRVTASVQLIADEVQVRVVVPAVNDEDRSRGYGLVGMRERVAMHGGQLSAGIRPGEGFTVEARIPVGAGT